MSYTWKDWNKNIRLYNFSQYRDWHFLKNGIIALNFISYFGKMGGIENPSLIIQKLLVLFF